MDKDPELTANYLLKEYESARRRIDSDIADMNRSEFFFVTIYGFVYWFILGTSIRDKFLLSLAFALPLVISIYGLLRYESQRYVIKAHEAYIKEKLDSYFLQLGRDPCGMIYYYDNFSVKFLKTARRGLYFVLIILSFLALGYFLWAGVGVLNAIK